MQAYFSDVLIDPNFSFSVEPRLLTTAMVAKRDAGGNQDVFDRRRTGFGNDDLQNGFHDQPLTVSLAAMFSDPRANGELRIANALDG